MTISFFDLFKIGIGPSSSHTVGPMWAARRFLDAAISQDVFANTEGVRVELFGSLALTGHGHGTDKAIMLGLSGYVPDRLDPDLAEREYETIKRDGVLKLDGEQAIDFREHGELIFQYGDVLPHHANGMRFTALGADQSILMEEIYYSVGGGFVMGEGEITDETPVIPNAIAPYPYDSAADLLRLCRSTGKTIAELTLANETTWRSADEVRSGILDIWSAMDASIERGCRTSGILPGGLNVARRAPDILKTLRSQPEAGLRDPLTLMDWVNLYALAVNEENAAGGRVVTAPTNGAAGVIPSVLAYYMRFLPGACDDGVVTFLTTASAIGALYKQNASISAAEVGCQGEVGVACSMAAAGLAAVMGATPAQIENAAEIAMEHNLGLTCDPIGGLVQIPCIERNTMGAVKAINAARLALKGDGEHFVSLDSVIETMHQTGKDMSDKYKETAKGGLAVNAVAC